MNYWVVGILALIGAAFVVYYIWTHYLNKTASTTGQSNIGHTKTAHVKPSTATNSLTGTGGAVNPTNSLQGNGFYTSAIGSSRATMLEPDNLVDYTDSGNDQYTTITGTEVT